MIATHYTHTTLGNPQIKMKLISNELTDVYIPTSNVLVQTNTYDE